MKNLAHTRDSEVILPFIVPTTTVAGQMVLIGTSGLFGVAETACFVASTYTGILAAPQGLKDGQASVRLTDVHTVMYLAVDAAGVVGAPVYLTATNVVTLTAGTNVKIGYLVDAAAAATVGGAQGPRVALLRG